MTEINNLKELEEYGKLKDEDIVIFTIEKEILKYKVNERFLHNINHNIYNSEIFTILKINKKEITEKTYRYKTTHGDWPCSKYRDYLALTRLVLELYRIIKEQKPVFTKFSRFEIMDI